MKYNSPLLVNIGQDLFLLLGLPRLPTWKTAERPKKPEQGTFGFNSQTRNLEYFDGSAWFEALLTES